jgi:hypothetical protein
MASHPEEDTQRQRQENTMRRIATLLAPLALVAVTPAFASEIDCFPACPAVAAPVEDSAPAFNACRSKLVQEGVKLDAKLAPARELHAIATDPTGYAIRKATDAAGIKVPKVVGYALDPKGSLRGELARRGREALKRQVGLGHACAELQQ